MALELPEGCWCLLELLHREGAVPPFLNNWAEPKRLDPDALLVCRNAGLVLLTSGIVGPPDPRVGLSMEGELALAERRLARSQPASPGRESEADGNYSEEDSPTRWAKRFGVCRDTFLNRVNKGKIRAIKMSDRAYRVHVDDLPPG